MTWKKVKDNSIIEEFVKYEKGYNTVCFDTKLNRIYLNTFNVPLALNIKDLEFITAKAKELFKESDYNGQMEIRKAKQI